MESISTLKKDQLDEKDTNPSIISTETISKPNKNIYWQVIPNYYPIYHHNRPPEMTTAIEFQSKSAETMSFVPSYQPQPSYPAEFVAYDYMNRNYNGYSLDQNHQSAYSNNNMSVVDYGTIPWQQGPQAILPHNPQIPTLAENSNQFYQGMPNVSSTSFNQYPVNYEDYNWDYNQMGDPYQYTNGQVNGYFVNNNSHNSYNRKNNFYPKSSKNKSFKQKMSNVASTTGNSLKVTGSTIAPSNSEDLNNNSYSHTNYNQKKHYTANSGFHPNSYYENGSEFYYSNLDPMILNNMANLSVDPQYGQAKYYDGTSTNHKFSNKTKSYAKSLDTDSNPQSQLNNSNSDKYNPKHFLITNELGGARTSRFFIIKSYSIDDIKKSIKYNVWCSTEEGNRKLDKAFSETQYDINSSVYLFFSVNGSGQFCGMAQMMSRIDYDKKSKIWSQNKWNGTFQVDWIYVKDVPNAKFRHIILKYNEYKPVTNSRDAQEVLFDEAFQVLCIMRKHVKRTSILDD